MHFVDILWKRRKYDGGSEMPLVLVQVKKCLAWLLVRALVGRVERRSSFWYKKAWKKTVNARNSKFLVLARYFLWSCIPFLCM